MNFPSTTATTPTATNGPPAQLKSSDPVSSTLSKTSGPTCGSVSCENIDTREMYEKIVLDALTRYESYVICDIIRQVQEEMQECPCERCRALMHYLENKLWTLIYVK